jgi:hypothetical protein
VSGAGDRDVAELNSKFVSRKQDKNKSHDIFQSCTIALLYKRTSKERRKGNPPTPNHLSLYTVSFATLEPFPML